MSAALDWDSDGRDWPHREASRFVEAGGLRWHVQIMGDGPPLLFLHGTGGSGHSWRDIMPAFAGRYTVIVPDLPGHGFTTASSRQSSLDGMTEAVATLLDQLGHDPVIAVGHSAGTAIALNLGLEQDSARPVIGFAPALMPFAGPAQQLFPAMAKLLFVNPLVPRVFSGIARLSGESERFLMRSTRSRVDRIGMDCYARLLGNSRHATGALAMMANWDLAAFKRRLPDIAAPVLLVHSKKDPAVPLASVREAAALIPDCELHLLERLGHLAHEEEPKWAAQTIADFAAKKGDD